jgi:hypothetical protein
MAFIKLMVVSLLTCLAASNLAKAASRDRSVIVEGNVNQTTQIVIPFKHLVSVTVSDEKFKKNLVFFPNRFRLQEVKKSKQLNRNNMTLL